MPSLPSKGTGEASLVKPLWKPRDFQPRRFFNVDELFIIYKTITVFSTAISMAN